MAMIQGRLSNFAIDKNSGTTYVNVGKLTDAKYQYSASEEESSNHDSAGAKEFLPGWTDWSFDLTFNWDAADTGQADLLTKINASTTFTFRARERTAVSDKEFTGTGFVTKWSPGGGNSGVATLSVSVRATGVVTVATQ